MNKQILNKVREYLKTNNIESWIDVDEVVIVVNGLNLTLSQGECINIAILKTESELEYLRTL